MLETFDVNRGAADNIDFTKKYLKIWADVLVAHRGEGVQKWYNRHGWTTFHMNFILSELRDILGYNSEGKCDTDCPFHTCKKGKCHKTFYQTEYYKIDFSLYNYFDALTWCLDYAIEHENEQFRLKEQTGICDRSNIEYNGWSEEFAKLLPVSSRKSRVVIGYDRFDMDFEENLRYCDHICDTLFSRADTKNYIAGGPLLLIIFPGTKYMKCGEYDKGLLYIYEYNFADGGYTRRSLYDLVMDENLTKKIKEVYNILAQ